MNTKALCMTTRLLFTLFAILSSIFGTRIDAAFQRESVVSHRVTHSALYFSDVALVDYLQFLNTLSEDEFKKELSAESARIRRENEKESLLNVVKALELMTNSPLEEERYLHLLVVVCYDLMFFTEFQMALDLVSAQASRVGEWKTGQQSALGDAAKANLLSIYGQLLVKKTLIAQALTHFFEAEKIYESLDSNHPSIFTIQVIIGEAFIEVENYAEALKYLMKAQELFPPARLDGRSYVAGLVAKASMGLGNLTKSHEVIHDYLENPIDPRKDYFLFFSIIHLDLLHKMKNTTEYPVVAQQAYELANTINNSDYLNEVNMHLGYTKLIEGDIDAAIDLLTHAIDGDKDIRDNVLLDGYLWLAEAYQQSNQYKKSVDVLREYIELFKLQQKKLNRKLVEDISAKNEVERSKLEAEAAKATLSLAQERGKTTKIMMYFLAVTLILLVFILWAISVALIKLNKKNNLLKNLSMKDPLTQTGNRLALSRDTMNEEPRMVILADIDHLKFYNDKFGHDEGDRLICKFVDSLKTSLKEYNASLYRIGGDEFVVTSDTDLSDHVEIIFDTIERDLNEAGFAKAGVSFGLAHEAEAKGFSNQLSLADYRMYELKAKKRQP